MFEKNDGIFKAIKDGIKQIDEGMKNLSESIKNDVDINITTANKNNVFGNTNKNVLNFTFMDDINLSKNTITINGITYTGKSCKIDNDGNIVIDGVIKDVIKGYNVKVEINGNVNSITTSSGDIDILGSVNTSLSTSSGEIKIEKGVNGNVSSNSGDIEVNGNANNIKTTSGEIKIKGEVNGYIETSSGNVTCGNVNSSIQTSSGDVECGTVSGNIKTVSGDISPRK